MDPLKKHDTCEGCHAKPEANYCGLGYFSDGTTPREPCSKPLTRLEYYEGPSRQEAIKAGLVSYEEEE